MRWDETYEELTAAGYVELIEDDGHETYLMPCLHSSECRGPTFLHFFLRRLDLKVVAYCASCDGVRVLAAEEVESPDIAA